MEGKRFGQEQIIGVLKESEAGAKMKDLFRWQGISGMTFYKQNRVEPAAPPAQQCPLGIPGMPGRA